MKFLLIATIAFMLAAVNAVQLSPVSHPAKCSCSMPDKISEGYENDDTPVYKAEVIENRDVGDPNYTYTVMRVKVVFRGCAPQSEYIIVKSPSTAGACGVAFQSHETYVVTAKLSRTSSPPPGLPTNMDTYMATSCDYNKQWGTCPYKEKVFLYYSPVRGC